MLELARVQIRAKELVGRLVNGTMGKLGIVRAMGEVVGGGVWREGASAGGMMWRLLVHLLLHGALFDVIGEFSWRHSETKETFCQNIPTK